MSVKSISTQQAGQVIDATHFLKLSDSPVTIFDIEGESTSAGVALYIQLHGVSPLTGVTVPLYSRLAVPAAAPAGVNGFSFVYRPLGLETALMPFPEAATVGGKNTTGVWVAISSTDNVYTSVAAATQVSVEIEAQIDELANETITGDLTTGVDALAVFTDPNAAKRLIQFQVKNNTGAVGYLMLFAYNPANGDLPLQQWKIADAASLTSRFGTGIPTQSETTAFVLKTGCYLVGSSTTQVLTKTVATNWTMKAWNV